MKFMIMYNGRPVGQIVAQDEDDANDAAREVFGDDVYCKADTSVETKEALEN